MGKESNGTSEYYDFVILGTGLAETIVSCLLAKQGKYSILHLDRNGTYGSELSTLSYTQAEEHFGSPDSKDKPKGNLEDELRRSDREFNIDLTPKLLLQDSALKEFLLEHEINEIVSFCPIKNSYFHTNKTHKVPASEAQAIKSSAVSLLQKPRVASFFWNCRSFYNGSTAPSKSTMMEEFASFGLNENSIDFIGHAVALNLDDTYLERKPEETYRRIVTYITSIAGYEGSSSPYLYPVYGISELCQAFSRRASIFGTVFMLNAKIHSIDGLNLHLTDPNGEERRIRAGKMISDPGYFRDAAKDPNRNPKDIDSPSSAGSKVAKNIIRCVMILRRSGKDESRNIIFLQKPLRRKNDIFCVVLGPEEMVCPDMYEIGIISTIKETDNPEKEIGPVLKNFDIVKKWIEVRQVLEDESTDEIVFTKGVDESVSMDNIFEDVKRILNELKISV